jgi:putative colanic acid biosynthesis acetyltransferase WcaF
MKAPTAHAQSSAYTSPWPWSRRVALLCWSVVWPLTCAWTPKPANGWRLLVLRLFGAHLHGRPFVHARARITQPWNLTLHDRACLGDHAQAYALGPIEIGADATIAQEAYLCTGTHDFTSPALALLTAPIHVGRGAFVGAHSLILPGLSLGEGCIIGAGAVVTRDVPPYAIVAGNPARVIGRRPRGTLPGDTPPAASRSPAPTPGTTERNWENEGGALLPARPLNQSLPDTLRPRMLLSSGT